jgi:hypothetical protein
VEPLFLFALSRSRRPALRRLVAADMRRFQDVSVTPPGQRGCKAVRPSPKEHS